jgi:hypothetical protein
VVKFRMELADLRRKDHRAAIADFRRHLGLGPAFTEQWLPAHDARSGVSCGFCAA